MWGVPATFERPIAPEQLTPAGSASLPPTVTPTRTDTADPAFGFAGETVAAVAFNVCLTITVTDDVLFDKSGSERDELPVTLRTYIPGAKLRESTVVVPPFGTISAGASIAMSTERSAEAAVLAGADEARASASAIQIATPLHAEWDVDERGEAEASLLPSEPVS